MMAANVSTAVLGRATAQHLCRKVIGDARVAYTMVAARLQVSGAPFAACVPVLQAQRSFEKA